MRKRRYWWLIAGILLLCLVGALAYRVIGRQINIYGLISRAGLADVTVPPGFAANTFAQGLNGPRFMALGPDGVLYVAERGNSRIVALPDDNGDGTADSIRVFADNLSGVHSLAFYEGACYAGVPSGVIRLQDTNGDGVANSRTTLIDNYPPGGQHNTRIVYRISYVGS